MADSYIIRTARRHLEAAAPFRSYGEDFDRAVDYSSYWLEDALDRGLSDEAIGVRSRELACRLEVTAPIKTLPDLWSGLTKAQRAAVPVHVGKARMMSPEHISGWVRVVTIERKGDKGRARFGERYMANPTLGAVAFEDGGIVGRVAAIA